MKYFSPLVVLVAFSLAACGQKPVGTPSTQVASSSSPAATSPADHSTFDATKMPRNMTELPRSMQAELPPLTQKAQVLSTINVPQYTYLEVKQDNNTRWLATTTFAAKKGDTIQFDDGTAMTNFNSKTLNRTFPSITFVGRMVISN